MVGLEAREKDRAAKGRLGSGGLSRRRGGEEGEGGKPVEDDGGRAEPCDGE